jgi:hypothetical protein
VKHRSRVPGLLSLLMIVMYLDRICISAFWGTASARAA